MSQKQERAAYLGRIAADHGGETCEFCGDWRPCECDEQLWDDSNGDEEEDSDDY